MSGSVLSLSEFERMKRSVLPETNDNRSTRRREHLKKLSDNKQKHWPNTLDSLRQKKLDFVKDKADAEEKQRQEVDRIEAELRRKARLETIGRANDLMYDQTDKMKGLKGAKLYAEVMQTRDQQIIDKQKKKEAEKVWAHSFHKNILESVAKGEAEDEMKKKKLADKIEIIKAQRLEQVIEVRSKREQQDKEAHAIGEAMKKRAKEQALEAIQEGVEKQKRIVAANATTLRANERAKVVQMELADKEKGADVIRAKEKEEIEGRKTALKALEKRRFEKKQETRQKMIDRAVELLASQKLATNAIETKQADEIRQKEDDAIAAKAAKRETERIAIRNSRTEMIAAKKERNERQWEEEDRLVIAQREKSAREEFAEQEKLKNEHENAKRLKAIQYSDAAKKQKKDVEAKVIAIQEAKLLQDVGNQDDDKFATICKSEILRFTKEGKHTYTLMRALETTQPALLPAKLDPSKRGKGLERD